MNPKIKSIAENTFYQLIIVYTIFVFLIALGLFWKYSLQFHIFAIMIGFLGISILSSKQRELNLNKKAHYILFSLAILLIILLRTIPYFGNSIPLGYDTGIYKYGIEHGLKNLDNWILMGGLEPGFLYLMTFLHLFLSSHFILTTLLISLCVILGIAIYFVVKEFSDSKTALISLFLYAFSIVQFKTFSYIYYKNILGMILILFAILFLKKYETSKKYKFLILFVILAGLLGAIHRPSFYIFGLSYLAYLFISPYKNKRYEFKQLGKNIIYGLLMIALAGLFYLGKFGYAITSMFGPVLQGFIQPGESGGTFINFFTYQFSSLFYLPFALLGLFYFIKKRDFNILVLWAIINLSIVYFQFFFFNRFIIMLDLVLIILAGFGFSLILKDTKKIGKIVLVILLISASIFAFAESINTRPLINNNELQAIKQIQYTEENAYAISTSSYYSPWILGYSGRKTIAPGLFDYNKHNKEQWNVFWTTSNLNEIKEFLNAYQKPLYIFIGNKQKDNLAQFNNSECFELYFDDSSNRIYKYVC